MKKLLRKDNYKRQHIFQNEINHFVLKNIANNLNFQPTLRWKAAIKLSNKFKKNNFQSIINRCIITTRKKRIHKLYSFSRIMFLKFINFGYINGVKKSSW